MIEVLAFAFAAAIGYRLGQREAARRRTARERRRRSWLAAKILDMRTDLAVKDEVALEILEERDELLRERASHHPEMN
jgi:hypothetical protein